MTREPTITVRCKHSRQPIRFSMIGDPNPTLGISVLAESAGNLGEGEVANLVLDHDAMQQLRDLVDGKIKSQWEPSEAAVEELAKALHDRERPSLTCSDFTYCAYREQYITRAREILTTAVNG